MNQFNFAELKIHTKKCLYINNNKAIVRNKKLYNIGEMINNSDYNNLYVEECLKDSKSYNDSANVYLDLGIISLYYNNSMDTYTTKEQIEFRLKYITNLTLEYILSQIRQYPNNNQFVNVADIKLLELSGASKEELDQMIEYRQNWYNRKEKESQEKQEQKEKEDQEYITNKNNEVEKIIHAAEQAIINKEKVVNEDITIYKSRYENNTTSLILHMMKLYNINVPLKTQGWINKTLANIFYKSDNEGNGYYSYQYYSNGSKNSEVFINYLDKLIIAINSKYNVVEEVQECSDADLDHLFGFTGIK